MPTDGNGETGETPSDVLQVIEGFSLNIKVTAVAGSSQGRVAVKSDGDRARFEMIGATEELEGGKDTEDASKLTAKGGLIRGEPGGKVTSDNP